MHFWAGAAFVAVATLGTAADSAAAAASTGVVMASNNAAVSDAARGDDIGALDFLDGFMDCSFKDYWIRWVRPIKAVASVASANNSKWKIASTRAKCLEGARAFGSRLCGDAPRNT